MQRWSLANWLSPIKHAQFLEMTKRYLELCEDAFGGPCSVETKARSQDLLYSTFPDPGVDDYLETESCTFDSYRGLGKDGLSPFGWRRARHVECVIRPNSGLAGMKYAFARVEFKGVQPRQATFCVQCADGDVKGEMIAAFPGMRCGDGYEGNGVDAKILPSSVAETGLSLPGYTHVL